MALIPTILSGGSGSRLWPISRSSRPKPFIRLADGESLLQKAFLRGAMLPEVAEIITVTNRDLFFQTEDEYRAINTTRLPTRFILEPFGRNTAAACATAAFEVEEHYGEDAMLLILAADHLITEHAAFQSVVARAMDIARDGKLVTFGITPSAPETGYGYIEAAGEDVIRFIEKPPLADAERYVAAGNYLWNSGMFCFSAGTLLRELRTHAPEILSAVEGCISQSRRVEGVGITQLEMNAETFATVPDISIDYALMERSRHVAVVPCAIGWSDIGSWDALGNLTGETDALGNRVVGEAVLHATANCYIQSEDRIIGAVGLNNLLIIDTPDALLVSTRDGAQDVKHIFAELKARAHESSNLHRTVHRPWGTYTIIEEGTHFKIKRVEVKPGAALSLQMHHHRSEHWIVVAGRAKVTNGDREFFVLANESTYIPAGNKHRLENPDSNPLIIIETQTGTYLGEDDIVRFADDYGRAAS